MIFWLKEYNERLALEQAKKEKIIYNSRINIQWMLYLYRILLSYTMGSSTVYDPWQHHSNIFLIYIYSVIVANQALLEKTIKYYQSDQYIKELKKSTLLSQQDIDLEINEASLCLIRFKVYEGIFRKLFQIPLNVMETETIKNYLPIFIDLTNDQITILKEQIIDPIFGVITEENGKFGIAGYFRNVYKSPLFGVGCNFNWETGKRYNCKMFLISSFPFPYEIYKSKQGYATPDSVKPLLIWNTLATNIKTSYDIAQTIPIVWQIYNSIIGKTYGEQIAQGKTAENVINVINQTYEDAKQAAENAITTAKEIGKEIADVGRSARQFIQNPPKPSDIINKIAITGGIVLAGYILMNEITS